MTVAVGPAPAAGPARRLDRAGARLRSLVAAAAGAFGALALPPLGATPALFVAFTVLVLVLDAEAAGAAGRRRAGRFFRAGWCFAFGYLLAGLWWIGAAFLVEPEFVYALPVAVAALPAGLALYTAAATAAAAPFWRAGPSRFLVLALALAVAEWLRGHLLTGFPWNGWGTAAVSVPLTMQAAAITGAYGLVPIAVLIFSAPAALFDPPGRGRTGILALAGALAAAVLGYGAVRLAAAGDAEVPGVTLQIVQPAIAQSEKWQEGNRWWIFDRLVAGTRAAPPPDGGTTIVVWPESSTPFLLDSSPIALAEIGAALPPGGVLLAGAARGEAPAPGAAPAGEPRYFNSILVVDRDGVVRSVYDKVVLVPFGEYLPLEGVLERLGLSQLAHTPGGFSAGTLRQPLAIPGAPAAAPLICYEAIFPDAAVPPGERPAWIVNVTNDAWFGLTPGPYQHFHEARLRAVEQGLPLVRAANTGISAVVDGYGRVRSELGLGLQGVLRAGLPAALHATPFARIGDGILLLEVVALLLAAVITYRWVSLTST